MNVLAILWLLITSTALLAVPRRWAPVPLLFGCSYMTLAQGIELGPVSLPIYRILLLVGLARILLRGERIAGSFNLIDKLMVFWSIWVLFASFFHEGEGAGPIYASGVVFNLILIYYLIRIWCRDLSEVAGVVRVVAVLLVPIALVMIAEKVTGKNVLSVLGGVPENVFVREGKLRAQGPFRHPILAGTVGATCIPLFVGIWNRHRMMAIVGTVAALIMVFACASSGPVMSLLAALGALVMWRFRHLTPAVRWASVVAYLFLLVAMEKPPYYLIARIDISGGSTGWHRSFLIEQTFKHLSEWWLFGTDYTRHWMPNQGIAQSPNHTDVTNYYIGFGVFGGLPSMLLIIAILLVAFSWVGKVQRSLSTSKPVDSFMAWCFGCSLFAHAATSISVAYFDQSMLFFWLAVAVVSSVYSIDILRCGRGVDRDLSASLTVLPGVAGDGGQAQSTTEVGRAFRRRIWGESESRGTELDGRAG
jgi:hypothetical protein